MKTRRWNRVSPDVIGGRAIAAVRYPPFQRDLAEAELLLPWSAQQLRKEIHANCEVLEERAEDQGAVFRLRGEQEVVGRLRERFLLVN